MKKIAIILNGISLKKKFFYKKVLPPLEKKFQVNVFETRTKSEGVSLATKAVEKRYDVLIAAGGDGTLHQVVNGMLQDDNGNGILPALSVFPLGSGNDFARSLKITRDIDALIERLSAFKYKEIDIGKINYQNHANGSDDQGQSYFINVADAGMGPEVVRRMNDSGQSFGPAAAYYLSILANFFSYKPMVVSMKTQDWEWKAKCRTAAIGNGKFYGHGLCIAPGAKVDDGVFSTFFCGDVSVLEFIRYSGKIKGGNKVNHAKVMYSTATHVELTSENTCGIEADGELLGFLPATIDIFPRKIKFLC